MIKIERELGPMDLGPDSARSKSPKKGDGMAYNPYWMKIYKILTYGNHTMH
jgi:hypothetical protein